MQRRVLRRPSGPVHDRRLRGLPRLGPAVTAALMVGLAACSSQGSGTTTTTTTTTSTTTSTTMPAAVPGTSILRSRVAPLAPGEQVLPVEPQSSAAWLKMVPIAYRSFGSGPDLLLISGQDGTLSWWGQALLSDLSGHYRVTVFDLPDVGYSGSTTAPLSLAGLADMTAGLALTIGLSDPVVLGWGLGGQIALSLVERHPGFAASLILVDTSAGGLGAVAPSKSVMRLLARSNATPVALSTLLFPSTPAGLQARLTWQSSLFAGSTDWMTARAVNAEAALQAGVWKRSPLIAALPSVTLPSLVVSGASDVVFPTEDSNLLKDELPEATEVVFPEGGYGALIQDAPAFVAAVEKFTGENVQSGSTSTTTTSPNTANASTTTTYPAS